jgi:hypothetical protein
MGIDFFSAGDREQLLLRSIKVIVHGSASGFQPGCEFQIPLTGTLQLEDHTAIKGIEIHKS